MKDLTQELEAYYNPVSALVFYQCSSNSQVYVEHFDMDCQGQPINAHPLTVQEAKRLSEALNVNQQSNAFLKPKGILNNNILHINPLEQSVIWFTGAGQRNFYFVDRLEIPNGSAFVPPLLWVANKESIAVYALAKDQRPTMNTRLYYAPFFNVYESGNVCMGTVNVTEQESQSLEEFTEQWENLFFNSKFSHLMHQHNPINGNCVSLWKRLVNTEIPFPNKVLKPTQKTLKDLIV